jgi:redox-sensitive bicupin YhaK (pirin superfamily)
VTGDNLVLSADTGQDAATPDLEVLVLGGQPIREPVAAYGPFVMNTRSEIAQAFEDYEKGKLGTIPTDHIGH